MSLFGNLFGKKAEKSESPEPKASPTSSDPRNDPNLIRVFDKYGRELFITKEEWRKNILPGNLKTNWNNPDQLYGIILGALNDGFRADIIEAARQLYKIDPQEVRGTCVWGIVLMEEGHLNEAERVFQSFIKRHGDDGVVLTNLAKVYAKRKDDAKAEEILWRGLTVDPNQDNGLLWYQAIHRDRGGEASASEALKRIAALPGSWRAQLWLARESLQSRNLDQALVLYRESLSRAGKPAPTDLLMQISGDLGNTGHLPEILELVKPHYDVSIHGLLVGNNLIKAYVDLGQLESARQLLDKLYALNRPDWKETLSFWDTEIAKTRLAATTNEQNAPFNVSLLTTEGPVWLKPDSPAAELYPGKSQESPMVAFLGGTAEIATNSKRVQHQLSDSAGRMSRALPFFFSEQVEFNTTARTQTLVPWLTEPHGGFVLSGVAWRDDDAAHHACQSKIKSDYVVISHLKTQVDPWTAELRLVRTIDGKCLGQLSDSFPMATPTDAVVRLARQLLELLTREAGAKPQPAPKFYTIPDTNNFPYYLLRLEQLLAVRCSSLPHVDPGFLSGEREIIDGNIQLCLATPGSVNTRILLAQTVFAMKKVRFKILPEFKEKLALLQKEQPLTEPAHGIVQRMFDEVLA